MGQPVAYTDHEQRLIATHEAGHAVTAWLVRAAAPPRGAHHHQAPRRPRACSPTATPRTSSPARRARCSRLIRIAMGGQSAEELFFDDVSTGPAGDLLYATNVAAQMVGVGRHDRHAHLVRRDPGQRALATRTSSAACSATPTAATGSSSSCRSRRRSPARCSSENRHLVEALRDALMERHELIGREITDILVEADGGRSRGLVDLRETSVAPAPRSLVVHPAHPRARSARPRRLAVTAGAPRP